jgi:hypothetical protein
MPQHTAHYHWVSCSSKQDNLMQPTCPMTSNADFGEIGPVIQKALDAGWTRTANGKDFLCPLHSKESVDTPARASRKAKAPTPESGQEQ